MKTITLTEQELRDFATNCFDFGVHGHRDPRTDEDMFELLVENMIKEKTPSFEVGDVVKVVASGKDVPTSIDHGQIGTVTFVDSLRAGEEQRMLVLIDETEWYFDLDGIMCGFEDCRIEKV